MTHADSPRISRRRLWPLPRRNRRPPKRIAIITTVWRYLSHAQHMGDRFLVGYPYDGDGSRPHMEVVSLYVDQKPEGDQSADRAREFGFQVYPTIAEALRCGGSKLAVDAVLIIGEHGNYPRNEKGQILYPRYEFFEQCAKVFEAGRPRRAGLQRQAPFVQLRQGEGDGGYVARLKFPMLAGSSLPVTWRLPAIELPLGCEIDDGTDGRRRRLGRDGLPRARRPAVHGRAAPRRRDRRQGGPDDRGRRGLEGADEGRYSKELLTAALSRSDTPLGLTVTDGRTQDLVASGELPKLVKKPAAYFIEYRDGLKATLLMLNGALKDFNFAARVAGLRGSSPRSSC